MRKPTIVILLLVLALFAMWPTEAMSQDQSAPQTGADSSSAQSPSTSTSSEQSSAPQMEPDTHSPGGGFLSSVGSIPELHSFLIPEISIGEEAFTNARYIPGAGQRNFETVTVPMGGLSLGLLGKQNQFAVDYLGGGFIYNSVSGLDSSFHELRLADSYHFRRGEFTLEDLFSYTPQAGFGLGGVGVLGGFSSGLTSGLGFVGGGFGGGLGGGGGQINPQFVPNESILSAGYGAYNNTTLAEVSYLVSPRMSIFGMGSYGTLQFGRGSGFINGNDAHGLIGLTRRLTAKDNIGATYVYSTFHYVGLPVSFNSQMADITYGHRITGRLGLEAFGGPELVTYTSAGTKITRTYLSGTGNLSYLRGRDQLGLYVGRFASGGSGVVPGAETITVSGDWGRQVTRTWTAHAYGGYSRNSGFAFSLTSPTGTPPPGATAAHYGYWFGNMTLNHPLSRHIRMYIGYEYQHQNSHCQTGSCGTGLTNQVLGIGFSFTPSPIQL